MLRILSVTVLCLTLGFAPLSAEERSDADVSTGHHVQNLEVPEDPNGNTDVISDLEFSPDSKMLAVAYGRFRGLLQKPDPGRVIIWDIASGKRLATLNSFKDGVSSVGFSADGKLLAAGGYDGSLQLWRVSDWARQVAINLDSQSVTALDFSPDNVTLAVGTMLWKSASQKSNLHLYQVTTGRESKSLQCPADSVTGVDFSPDGKSLVCAGLSGIVQVWNIEAGTSRTIFQSEDLMLFSLTVSHDGQLIAAGGDPFQYKHKKWQVQIWDTESGKLRQGKTEAGWMLSYVRFSSDDRWLVIATREAKVKLWNLSTGRLIDVSQPGEEIAISPDGKLLALANGNRVALLEFAKLIDRE
ncbi:WD domain, G-beta repeat [Gimesia panareensis]|uniref:WD domain, G-beta repeat n=1 Tax=Gimesia panareensis TaxID=2527978 RepID=A0A518FJM3_9PLAN|nr:hypothetical protein [Gimesia panareensis]QDV16564.1 WD domain, G-beta repeat [Gimesia panareensis]